VYVRFNFFKTQKMATTKEAAVGILFNQGIEQKEIAKLLKISEVTISRYVTKNGLKKKRLIHSVRRETSEENALTALMHQSTVVRRMAELAAESMTDTMSMEDLKAALLPKGEIDALQKLFTTVKGKEMEWSGIVRVMREFMNYLKDENMEVAQSCADYTDAFINEKRKAI
jgi:predicted transcriptional regulator